MVVPTEIGRKQEFIFGTNPKCIFSIGFQFISFIAELRIGSIEKMSEPLAFGGGWNDVVHVPISPQTVEGDILFYRLVPPICVVCTVSHINLMVHPKWSGERVLFGKTLGPVIIGRPCRVVRSLCRQQALIGIVARQKGCVGLVHWDIGSWVYHFVGSIKGPGAGLVFHQEINTSLEGALLSGKYILRLPIARLSRLLRIVHVIDVSIETQTRAVGEPQAEQAA